MFGWPTMAKKDTRRKRQRERSEAGIRGWHKKAVREASAGPAVRPGKGNGLWFG